MTLDAAPANADLTVVSITGGIGVRRKLNNMGIHTGDPLMILRSGFVGGPLLVSVHGMSVALGRGMARSIVVKQS